MFTCLHVFPPGLLYAYLFKIQLKQIYFAPKLVYITRILTIFFNVFVQV